jgi:two-component system NarL family response regulator
MNSDPIRVFLVEDQCLVGTALELCLRRVRSLQWTGQASTCRQALALGVSARPDVAIIDIGLPDGDGLDLGAQWLARQPGLRLLALSGQSDPYTIWRVSQSEFHGYVGKGQTPQELITAIEVVGRGGSSFGPDFHQVRGAQLGRADSFHKTLTKREMKILRAVTAGQADEVIARQLDIALATVQVHRRRVREKLGLHNDRDLLRYAREWGLTGPG